MIIIELQSEVKLKNDDPDSCKTSLKAIKKKNLVQVTEGPKGYWPKVYAEIVRYKT